ncbi:hypothetical protein JXD38_09195 [candidate division WOR-3 bacterium]|nr:hypothetical protein [candidate division WOR-3 bacterium]
MSVVSRRNAVVIGSLLLLCSLGFGAWEQLTSGTIARLNGVHFPAGTMIGYAVGSDLDSMGMPAGAVFKTDDGGATWTPQTSNAASQLNSVYFIDDNTGYAVGDAGAAIRTTDGGASWNPMTVGSGDDQYNYVGFPGGGQTGFIGVNPRSQSAKAYKTTDGGANWASITVGGAMNWTTSCAFADDNIGVVLGRNGFVWGTNDGLASGWYGGAWTNATLSAAAFARDDANYGILIGNDSLGGIIRSTGDAGVSVWDSCRYWRVTYFSGVDMPVAGAAYVCGDSAGQGFILRQVANHPDADFFRTTVPSGTPAIADVCFPGAQDDTGYAVGNNGWILKTTDKGVPWLPGVAEGKAPVVTRAGIRVLSNPCRRGIMLHSDADVRVSVFDAAGRTVMSRAAARGTNFLPLPTGAYFVKAGTSTARAVVTD